MGHEFLGVYATSEKAPSLGDHPRPLAKRKRLWFVWSTPEGRYKVQALNAVLEPMAEPRLISVREFEDRYALEPECEAVPEGYVRPVAAAPGGEVNSLPDLFTGEPEPAPRIGPFGIELPPEPEPDEGALRADDPCLIRNWAKSETGVRRSRPQPAPIPFERLVGDMAGKGNATSKSPAHEAVPCHTASKAEGDEIRELRSRFVQALLKLRQGQRSESMALLRDMLNRKYPQFEGGAQLFSEFGLGLRRLGLASLALSAHLRALDFAPRDERILFNIARSYHDLDHVTEAREYLEEALAVAPDFTVARQFLEFMEFRSPVKDDGVAP